MGFLNKILNRGKDTPKILVAIDWEQVRQRMLELDWLKTLEKTKVLLFMRTDADDSLLTEFKRKIEVEIKVLPKYAIQLQQFMSFFVIKETSSNTYKELIIIGTGNTYNSLVEFIKEQGLTIQNKSLADVSKPYHNERQGQRTNDVKPQQNRNTQQVEKQVIKPAIKTQKPTQPSTKTNNSAAEILQKHKKDIDTKPSPIRQSKPQQTSTTYPSNDYTDKIISTIKQEFILGENCPKKVLGGLIKRVTGKTVQEVFNTPNSKYFIINLIRNKNIEEVDALHCKFITYPTPQTLQRTVNHLSTLQTNDKETVSNKHNQTSDN